MKKPNIWTGFTLVILCFFLLFVVYPLFLIMYQSVVDPETHALTLLSVCPWLMFCAALKSLTANMSIS